METKYGQELQEAPTIGKYYHLFTHILCASHIVYAGNQWLWDKGVVK